MGEPSRYPEGIAPVRWMPLPQRRITGVPVRQWRVQFQGYRDIVTKGVRAPKAAAKLLDVLNRYSAKELYELAVARI